MSEQHKQDEDTRAEPGTVSRRTFMQGVLAASAAASAVGLPMPAGAAASPAAPVSPVTAILTADQGRVLTRILNQLIPAEGVLPGAGDAGVAGFIDKALAVAPHLRRHIIGIVTALPDAEALGQWSAEQVDARLQGFEQAQPEAFDLLLQATYTGYYSHPQVVAALGMQSDQEGHRLLDRFDLQQLAELQAHGPITTDV